MNPREEEDLDGSYVNPFHWRIPLGDHHRQRKQLDQRDDLNVKIEIPEYNGSLRGEDFMEQIKGIMQIFEISRSP